MKNPWIGVGLAGAILVTAILLHRLSIGYYLVLGILVAISFIFPPLAVLFGGIALLWIIFSQFHPLGKNLRSKTGGWL